MADENFGQNKKDAKEYYDTQRQIAKVIKQQTESWSTYGDAQKTVAENAKQIRDTQKRINELLAEGSKEAKAEAAELQKQVDYTRELNKELAKTSVLLKAGGKAIGKWGMDKLSKGFDNILDRYNRMDRSSREAAINIGMSTTRMNQFRMVVAKSQSSLTAMGVELEKAGQMQESFADATGRQVMLTEKTLVQMAALAKTTGMAEEEMAGLVGQMDSFGMGAQASSQAISNIVQRTNKLGLNTKNVMKKITQNVGLLNKLSFKNGINGLAKMARYSEKYKLSLEAAAGFAEKVMRPEGAIDAAANLQVLGGSMAQMGDAFQLMGQARNNPEEFIKTITKGAAEAAQWDDVSKSFKVSAYQMDRLREASEATGISVEELAGTAKQTAKMNMFGNLIKISGDDKEFLSGIMELDSKGQAFLFDEKGHKQYLKDLSATDQQAIADKLTAEKETEKERAIARQTSQDLLVNNLNALLDKLMPAIVKFDDSFRPMLEALLKKLQSWADALVKNPWLLKLALGLMIFAKVAPILSAILSPLAWLLKGRMLARGFNAGVAKGPLGAAGGAQGGAGSNMVKAKSGKMYDAESPQGKMIRTKGGTQALDGGQAGKAGQMGDSAGKSSSGMLKGAAAILILSAALFVFAKALQEFDKLQNGWESLALAAAGLTILSIAAKAIGSGSQGMIMGALAIAILGAALIPFAYAMQLMGEATNQFSSFLILALGLTGLAIAASLIGAVSPMVLLGALAIGVLSLALIPLAYAVKIVSEGIAMVVDSFTNMFSVINISNIGPLLLLGPALIGTSIGVFALSASLFALGAAWWFGGSAFKDLTHSLAALKGLDLSGMSSSIRAINHVDLDKIEAIKDLASMLSLVSLFGGIKIEFGEIDVKGTINLKGGSGVSRGTDWVNDPIFVSKLKNLIWESTGKGKKGGKS